MKPSQLVAQLTEIVAKHTNSTDAWRDSELTDRERVSIFAELEQFIRAELRKWQAELRQKMAEAGVFEGLTQPEIDKIIEDLWRKSAQ